MDTFKCPPGWTGRTKRIPLFIVMYVRPEGYFSLLINTLYKHGVLAEVIHQQVLISYISYLNYLNAP
jgi:hypothetical protein